ncbi:hypothetical protein KM043_010470 [Ampulex compressa]|nr:hypothetical protein KM043_010470 [Ampulex compressa]
MSIVDHYEILGCPRESSHEDIKRAYRRCALLLHPDKCGLSESNAERFREVLEAWRTLSQPESRKEYDALLSQAELDAEGGLIYARISRDNLEPSKEENVFTYRCRCGSDYSVDGELLRERNRSIHVECRECTFVLVVET